MIYLPSSVSVGPLDVQRTRKRGPERLRTCLGLGKPDVLRLGLGKLAAAVLLGKVSLLV